mmetsp:Transcript_14536/g.47365  ORF Transcript_14536/g.47365 Transcript_14536/m.47365 type:complete len:201 (-) Transcript_14536:2005-2607(-)
MKAWKLRRGKTLRRPQFKYMFHPAARTRVKEFAVWGTLKMLHSRCKAMSWSLVAIQAPACGFTIVAYASPPISTACQESIPFSHMICLAPMPMPVFSKRCHPSMYFFPAADPASFFEASTYARTCRSSIKTSSSAYTKTSNSWRRFLTSCRCCMVISSRKLAGCSSTTISTAPPLRPVHVFATWSNSSASSSVYGFVSAV